MLNALTLSITDTLAVIDPGPEDDAHFDALIAAIGSGDSGDSGLRRDARRESMR